MEAAQFSKCLPTCSSVEKLINYPHSTNKSCDLKYLLIFPVLCNIGRSAVFGQNTASYAMLSLQQFIWNVMDCPKKKKGGGWCVNTLGHMWHRFIFLFSNNFAQLLACILIHISDLVARTFQCFSAIWLQLLKWVGTGNKWKWVKTANKCLHVILRKIICKDKKKISVKYIIFLFCKVLRENLELQTLWSFSFFLRLA